MTRFFPLATLTMVSCAAPQANESLVEVITGEERWVTQGLTSGALAIDWELDNPTPRGATLEKIEWVLTVDEDSVFRGTVQPNAAATPGSTARGVLRVGFDLPRTPAALEGRAQKDLLRYHVVANFFVAAKSAEVFEAEWHGELLSPRVPEVSARVGASRMDDTVAIDIAVSVSNRNPFPIRIDALPYVLRVGGVVVKQGTLMEIAHTLQPASELQFDLTQALDTEATIPVGKKLNRKEPQEFLLETTLKMKDLVLPQRLSGQIDPPRR